FPLTPQARLGASLLGALAPAIPWALVVAARRLVSLAGYLGRQRQFSLRGLLVLVVVCAVGAAIWDHWLRPVQERWQFMTAVGQLNGSATTDSLWVRFSLNGATDNELAYLTSLPGKRKVIEVTLKRPSITDDGVAYLARFPELNTLVLDGCQITDE